MDEVKDRSLVARVLDGLVSAIVDQKYAATLPPQDVLSKEFGVSRTVMREAVSMLIARNMVEVRPKTGTRIRPMSDWRLIDDEVVNWRFRAKPNQSFLRDVIEMRILIEPRAAELAAENATPGEIAAIRTAFETLSRLPFDAPDYQAADDLLHARIVAASGNQFFRQMTAIVRGTQVPVAVQLTDDDTRAVREALLADHRVVVESIEAKDPASAALAMYCLVQHTVEALFPANDPRLPSAASMS